MDQSPVPEVNNIPSPIDRNPEEVLPVKPSFAKPILLMSVLIVLLLGTSAFLYYQNTNLQKQINALQVSPLASSTPNPTTNWKTYTNSKAGYEIKYPAGWFITNDAISNVQSPLPEKGTVVINFYSVDGSTTNLDKLLDSILKDFKSMGGDPAFTSYESKTSTTVAEYPALKVSGKGYGGNYLSYLIANSNTKTNAHISITFQEGDLENFQSTIDQILSTFKFLKPMTQIPANGQIFLSVLNRPDGNNTPKKMSFDYQRKSDDKIFLIEDQSSEGIQEGFIIQRGVISLKVTPQFEGFPWAHTDNLVVELDNPKLTSEKIFRTVAEIASDGYEYVTNYSAGSECGEPKIGTVACSLSNVSSNKVDLNIVCNSSATNVFECDQIVKTLTFSWQ